jgi:hypothetical protein
MSEPTTNPFVGAQPKIKLETSGNVLIEHNQP